MLTTANIIDWLPDNLTAEHRSFIGCDLSRLDAIAKQMTKYGLSALSPTLITRAIKDLGLTRQYDPAADAAADQNAQAIRKADTVELTKEFGNELNRMSPAEVAAKYYGDPYFRRLYDRAASQWGYKIPQKPTQQPSGPSVAPITLTAREYHSLPAAVVCRRLREPSFRAAVELLISQGLIVLLLCIGVFK